MRSQFIDIHPHIISDDEVAYPHSPLFGKHSKWSRERPVPVEGLIQEMDEAGIDKAAVVQASTCYGFDNTYLADSIARYPGRLTGVGTVDLLAEDARSVIEGWHRRGISGLRMFTGSAESFDPSVLDDPRSFAAWEFCGEIGLSMVIQSSPSGLSRIASLATRFPKVKILLDHAARPKFNGGSPYEQAAPLFAMAPYENVYVKLTPRVFHISREGKSDPASLFGKFVEIFGAARLAWGSNFPSEPGGLKKNIALAENCFESLSAEDRSWIFAKTAQHIYPALAD